MHSLVMHSLFMQAYVYITRSELQRLRYRDPWTLAH